MNANDPNVSDLVRANGGRIEPVACRHPAKKSCVLCGELYCPADGCDPNHVEFCREALRA